MKKSIYLSALAAAVILSSCSNNEEPGIPQTNGQLRVSASINQVKSRAAGTEWAVGDKIGVTGAESDFVNVPYTAASTSGDFAATGTGIFLSGNDEIAFSAYYPYNDSYTGESSKEISFKVANESGVYTSTPEAIDFLFAPAVNANVANPAVIFQFSHSMAKLVFNVTDATNTLTAEDCTMSLTIEGIATEGTFDVTTGVVTPSSTLANLSSDFNLGENIALIVPAWTATPETMKLVVNVTKDGKESKYSVAIAPALEAGTQYGYTLKLNYGKNLDIEGTNITDWTSEDVSNELVSGDVKIANIGDYLMKDGSIVKKAALTDDQKENVAGVVYFVGNPQLSMLYPTQVSASADQLRLNYSSCFNGLAIALNNANETATRFATADCNYLTIINPFPTNTFSNLTMNISTEEGSEYITGFNNTAYVNYVNSLGDNTTAQATVTLLADYNNSNPVTDASTWYIPSMGEFKRVQANYETIKESVEKAGGKLDAFADFATTVNENFYWTSDFRGGRNSYVSTLSSETGTQNLYQQRTSNGTNGWFRLCIAF